MLNIIFWVSPHRAKSVPSTPVIPGLLCLTSFKGPLYSLRMHKLYVYIHLTYGIFLTWKYQQHHCYYLSNEHRTVPIAKVISIKFGFKKKIFFLTLCMGYNILKGLSFTSSQNPATLPASWNIVDMPRDLLSFLCFYLVTPPPTPNLFNSLKTLN